MTDFQFWGLIIAGGIATIVLSWKVELLVIALRNFHDDQARMHSETMVELQEISQLLGAIDGRVMSIELNTAPAAPIDDDFG